MDRAERRDRTSRHIRRQLELRKRIFLNGDPSADNLPRRSAHYWNKNKPLACHCAKRKHGNPRVDHGLCWLGLRDRIYEWRAAARELRVLARRGFTDWGDDMVSVMEDDAYPRYYHDEHGALKRS